MIELPTVFLTFGLIFMLLLLVQFARILRTREQEPDAEMGMPEVGPMTEATATPSSPGTLAATRPQNSTADSWLFTLTPPLINRVSTGADFELHFVQPCSIQTVLPFPRERENCYFEIRFIELPETTNLVIGLAPKDEVHDKIPGKGKHSVGLETNSGFLLTSNFSHEYGNKIFPGDVIGCGFRPLNDRVFFTRNGRRYPRVVFEHQSQDIFPTIYASGPCVVEYNFGQHGFTLSSANTRGYGLTAPNQLSVPPPSYNHHSMDMSIRSSRDSESFMISESTSTHLLSPTIQLSPTTRPPPYVSSNEIVSPTFNPSTSHQS
ncbi:Protein ssh4 [Entomophthora muscae]|uniref:Protein ssh4 n=1 Tax=Entomophthora muscae TaxID=34485 RepID=A0ACC2T9B5_9FUNG|nr:Protein ssh4 [Entomophthora muscae]